MKYSIFNYINARQMCAWALFLSLSLAHSATAQTPPGWAWAKSIGGFSNQTYEENWGRGIGVDAAGNVYVLGDFTGTASFDGLSATSAGENDIYLAKYTPGGSLVWQRQLAGTSKDFAGQLLVDAAGNTFLTGMYGGVGGGDLTFPDGRVLGGPVTAGMPVTSPYPRFSFAASFDALGEVRWATRLVVGYNLTPAFLTLDTQGNLYVSGSATSSVTLNGQSYPAIGTNDGFLLKLSGAGQVQWLRRVGGTGVYCSGQQVVTDNADAVYWSYEANGPVQLGTTTGYASTNSIGTPVVKFSAQNRLLWVRSLSTSNGTGLGNAGVTLLGIDKASNTLLAGGEARGGAVVSFPNYLATITAPTGSDYGVLLATADTAGSVTWAHQLGTTSLVNNIHRANVEGLTRNARQELVITLGMGAALTVPGYGTITPASDGVMVMEFNPATTTVRSARLAAMSRLGYADHANTVVDAQNNILVAGSFSGTATFGATTLTSTISVRRDAFFAKLDQNVLSNRRATLPLSWQVYPNPARQQATAANVPAAARLLLLDALGRTVRVFGADPSGAATRPLPLAGLAPGLYLLRPETATDTYPAQRLVVE